MYEKHRMITVASWEQRFLYGTLLTFEKHPSITRLDMFFYREYALWSEDNRAKIAEFCKDRGVYLTTHELSFETPALNWRIIEATVTDSYSHPGYIVDITTMPRDTIWAILHFLEERVDYASYVYYKPETYNKEWLSRDPGRPRLAFRRSGIATLGAPTLLLTTTGFDVERTEQLINYFEPKKIILAIQQGDQFENIKLNLQRHEQIRSIHSDVIILKVDSYSQDHSFSMYETALQEHVAEYNVVLSSLGPKPSSIALFHLTMRHPEMALVYAPSNQFNLDYSQGLGQAYEGTLVFREENKQ